MKTMDQAGTGKTPVVVSQDAAPPRRLSEILRQLAATVDGPLSIGTIREAMGDRGLAALLVLFAALNLLPLPPGTTLVLGLPLLLVSGQMVFGYRTAWLPQNILRRTISADRFRSAVESMVPWLERLERLIRPRRWPFRSAATADRVIGSLGFLLGLAVTLPIPLGNWLPAFAVALLGLSLSERDGLFFGAAIGVGILSLLIIAAVIGAAGVLASAAFGIHF